MLPVRTGLSSRCIVTTTNASPAHTTDSPATPAMQNARRTRPDRLDRLVGGCPECVTLRSSTPGDIGLSDFDNTGCSTGVAHQRLRVGPSPRAGRRPGSVATASSTRRGRRTRGGGDLQGAPTAENHGGLPRAHSPPGPHLPRRRPGGWHEHQRHRQGLGVLATVGGQVRQRGARRGGFRDLSSVSRGPRTRPPPGYGPGHCA